MANISNMILTDSLMNYSVDLLTLGFSVLVVGGGVLAYSYFSSSSTIEDIGTQTISPMGEKVDSGAQTIVTGFNPDNIVHNADYFKTALVSDISIDVSSSGFKY